MLERKFIKKNNYFFGAFRLVATEIRIHFFTILFKESDIFADISNMWNWYGLRMTFILKHVAILQSQHPNFIDASYTYFSNL